MQTDIELLYFCQNIRYLRKANNLTQIKMANLLGISVKTLRQLEHDIIPPKLKYTVLVRIYDVFQIQPDAMFSPLNKIDTDTT